MRLNGRHGRGHRHGGHHGDCHGPDSHGLRAATATRVAVSSSSYCYDKAGALAVIATRKPAVSYEPLFYSGTGVRASQVSTGDRNVIDHGDVLVYGLWKRGEQAVLDTQVVDCDAPSRRNYMDSEKILESCARVKKLKYLQPCAERRRSFTPLIYSVDEMAGGRSGL